jgi:hypothetical protein
MVTMLEIGRKVFMFTLIVDILDLGVVYTFIASGVPVPSLLLFYPQNLVSFLISMMDYMHSIYVPNIFIFIIALAFIGVFTALFDFIIGMLGGWVLFVMNAASYFGLAWYTPATAAAIAMATMLQGMVYWYGITQLLMLGPIQ